MPPSLPAPPTLPGAYEPTWLEDGTPYTAEFGDVYYSRDGGCAESRHVFLEPNRLAERFAALDDSAQSVFVIGETGFGTGLNFLLAWQLWRHRAPANARLVFRSLESRPLSHSALSRALGAWSELAEHERLLLAAWPPCLGGLHLLEFDAGRVCLQLYIGEASQALEELLEATPSPAVDAWFLDGFAPARNPAMWTDALLARIGATSRAGATFATFTAAGAVRAGLERAGFAVRKIAGFGRKREMLCGERSATAAPPAVPAATPWHRGAAQAIHPREALVVGAGIAGCTTALALARRGWSVAVLEAADAPAASASGNPQAILFTQLPAGDSAHGEFTLASFLHATRFHAAQFADDSRDQARCGLLQLVADAALLGRLRTRYRALPELARIVDREQASAIAGVTLGCGGVFLPAAGWIDPRAACARALAHPRIALQCRAEIVALTRDDGQWHALAADGRRFAAPIVVLANARAANALLGTEVLPLAPVRGQVSLLPATALPTEPRCVLCADGYLIPPRDGTACCGASFLRGELATEPTLEEHLGNLRQLAAMLTDFDVRGIDPTMLGGRVAERCTTPDRLPVIGRVADSAAFTREFGGLRGNARRLIARHGEYLPGLLVNVGHGSRGMTSAPLAAEWLAAELCGEPLPVTRRVQRALSPARFLIRAIVRGEAG